MGKFLVIKGADFSQSAIGQSVIINLAVSPNGGGQVTGSGRYNIGDSVTISAISNSGYHFVKWSDNVTDNIRSFIASESLQLTAIFEQGEPQITWYNDISSMSPSSNGFFYSGDGTPGPAGWVGYTADDTVIIGQPINILSVKYKAASFNKNRYAFRLLTINGSNVVTSSIVLKQFDFSSTDAQAGEKQVKLDTPVTLVQGQRIFIGCAENDVPGDEEVIPCGRLSSGTGTGIGYVLIKDDIQTYNTVSGSVPIGYGFMN